MSAKDLLDWCKVPAALLAMLAAVSFAIDARAQEAAREAAKEEMVPIQQSVDQTNLKLEELVEQGRRQEDRELMMLCLDRKYQSLDADERFEKCEQESAERWEQWEQEDEEAQP